MTMRAGVDLGGTKVQVAGLNFSGCPNSCQAVFGFNDGTGNVRQTFFKDVPKGFIIVDNQNYWEWWCTG